MNAGRSHPVLLSVGERGRLLVATFAILGLMLVACASEETLEPAASTTAAPSPTADAATNTTHLVVTFTDEGCSSSEPTEWPEAHPVVDIDNRTRLEVAVVMGVYHEGFGYRDLLDYGSDVSTRPPFIDALEIFGVSPNDRRAAEFDHGPGQYFVVCMPDSNTMTPLGDLTPSG